MSDALSAEDLPKPATSVLDAVEERLRNDRSDDEALALWAEVRREYEDGGAEAVKSYVAQRIKDSKKSLEKELRVTRSVTKSTVPKKKAPAKKTTTPRKRV